MQILFLNKNSTLFLFLSWTLAFISFIPQNFILNSQMSFINQAFILLWKIYLIIHSVISFFCYQRLFWQKCSRLLLLPWLSIHNWSKAIFFKFWKMIIRYKGKNIGNVSLKKINEEGLFKKYILYISEWISLITEAESAIISPFFFWFHDVYMM